MDCVANSGDCQVLGRDVRHQVNFRMPLYDHNLMINRNVRVSVNLTGRPAYLQFVKALDLSESEGK